MAARSNGTIAEAAQIDPPTAVSIVQMVTGTLLATGNSRPPYNTGMPVDVIFANWGANDATLMGGGTVTEANFIADYQDVLDYLHSVWPDAQIYLTKVWRSDLEAECDTMAGWIDTIVASRAFAHVGDDERDWFDADPATFSEFGLSSVQVHYSPAGDIEAARQKAMVLGWL
jgi:hypothetical protein